MATLDTFAVILLMIASLVVLLSLDWRTSIAAMAGQTIGVTILVASLWPLPLAIVKLLVGLGCAGILALSQAGDPRVSEDANIPTSYLFRCLAGGLVLLLAFSMAPIVATWLPGVHIDTIYGGLVLICMGLLELGMTTHPMRVIMGLLTVMAGFEIIYAGVEISVLVAGLLAGVDLGLAISGAYLINRTVERKPV